MSIYTFSATPTNNKTIEIQSNTYWSCKAEGNFMLSDYYGSGDTSIDIIIPDGTNLVEGNVYFTYGDNKCGIVNVNVYNTDEYVINTIPSYEICDNKKTISFKCNDTKEVFYIEIESYGEWEVTAPSGVGVIKYQGGIMLIGPENAVDTPVIIKPKGIEDDKYTVYVNIIK